MNTLVFERLLIDSLRAEAVKIGKYILILAIILTVDVAYYCMSKSNNAFSIWSFSSSKKKNKTKLTAKNQIGLCALIIAILIVVLTWSAIRVHTDISKQQYLCVTTDYEFTSASLEEGGLLSNGYVYISVDGKKKALELPADWNLDTFPQGSFYGDVWYSKASKYILAFEVKTAG